MSSLIYPALRLSVAAPRTFRISGVRRFLSIKPVYTAEATAQGGRNGKVKTSDGLINLDLTTPKGLGGPGLPGKTNPEQLFACGYAACFRGAMGPAAKQFNTELPDTTTVTGVVHIGPDAQNKLGLAVELKVHVPGIDKKVVEAIVEAADQVCPYSSATRGNIDVIKSVV